MSRASLHSPPAALGAIPHGLCTPTAAQSFTCERCAFRLPLPLLMDRPLLLSYSMGNRGIKGNRHKLGWVYSPRAIPPPLKLAREVAWEK